MKPALLKRSEVAILLGFPTTKLKPKFRAQLEAIGFPGPLAMPGQMRWSRKAVERWIDQQIPLALQKRCELLAANDQPIIELALQLQDIRGEALVESFS